MQTSEHIMLILRQTSYSEETAREKLMECNGNYVDVIKQYMGVKSPTVKTCSVNQEIYKQLRYKMNSSTTTMYVDEQMPKDSS